MKNGAQVSRLLALAWWPDSQSGSRGPLLSPEMPNCQYFRLFCSRSRCYVLSSTDEVLTLSLRSSRWASVLLGQEQENLPRGQRRGHVDLIIVFGLPTCLLCSSTLYLTLFLSGIVEDIQIARRTHLLGSCFPGRGPDNQMWVFRLPGGGLARGDDLVPRVP